MLSADQQKFYLFHLFSGCGKIFRSRRKSPSFKGDKALADFLARKFLLVQYTLACAEAWALLSLPAYYNAD
jgi:hypothetical protein